MSRTRPVRSALAVAMLALTTGCSVVGAPAGGPEPVARPPRAEGGDTARAPVDVTRVGPEAGPTRRFDEVRGLWVVRTTLSTPERVRRMVAAAADAGFNTLLVQVRGRGDAYYDSRWEPRAAALEEEPDFDPLALVIREAHARGMAVHAWVNTHLVWSGPTLPASPRHVVNAHPEWLGVPRSLAGELFSVPPEDPRFARALLKYAAEHPKTVEGMFTSPSSLEVKEHVYDLWMDLAERYEVDGIHFDYIRFPSADYDYSRGALDRFRAWVAPRLPPVRLAELDGAYRKDPFAFTDALPAPWDEFRREQITALVERVYHGVKARRPDIVVSASVFSNADDAYRNRFQDWRTWLDRNILDVVVPMAYTADDDLFRSEVRDAAVSAGRSRRVWAGIGAYLNTYDGTLRKIDIARAEHTGGLVLFSYDWAEYEAPSVQGVSFLERVGLARFQP